MSQSVVGSALAQSQDTSAVDLTRMKYRGVWASQPYALNDVVTYNNRLYACTTATGAVAPPTFVGNTKYDSMPSSATTISLPAGCAAGDVVVLVISSYGTVYGTLAGWTTVGSVTNAVGLGSHLYVYTATLAASDVTAGTLAIGVPTSGTNQPCATLTAFRNATTPSTIGASSTGSSFTTPAFTPTNGSLLLGVVADGAAGSPPAASPTATGFSNTIAADTAGQMVLGVGTATGVTGVTQASVTWTGPGHLTTLGVNAVVQVAGSAVFPASAFTEIADDNSLHYKGTWTPSAFAINDVVSYNKGLYVCTTPTASAPAPTFVGSRSTSTSGNSGSLNIALPTGSAAGDLAVIGLADFQDSTGTPVGPTGSTLLIKQVVSSNSYLAVFTKTLTSADITNGYLIGPPQANNGPSWALHTFRNAVVGTPVSNATATTGAVTPTGDALVYEIGMSAQQAMASPGLAGPATGYNTTVGLALLAGYDAVSANVTSTARTFTGATSFLATVAVALSGPGGFQANAFTRVANDNPIVLNSNIVTASGAAQIIPSVLIATMNSVTLNANCTLTFPAAQAGAEFYLALVQDGTGGWTVTWPTSVKWPGGTAPTLTTAAAKTDYFHFMCVDGTNWLGIAQGANY